MELLFPTLGMNSYSGYELVFLACSFSPRSIIFGLRVHSLTWYFMSLCFGPKHSLFPERVEQKVDYAHEIHRFLPCGASSRSCWVGRLLKTWFWCQLGDNTCRMRMLDGACVLNQDSIWGWFFQSQNTQVKVSSWHGILISFAKVFSPLFSVLWALLV